MILSNESKFYLQNPKFFVGYCGRGYLNVILLTKNIEQRIKIRGVEFYGNDFNC